MKNHSKVPVINDNNHNITVMKNSHWQVRICNINMQLEIRANTGDPTRIGNAAINKAEVVNAYEPTADSKEDSASGKDGKNSSLWTLS